MDLLEACKAVDRDLGWRNANVWTVSGMQGMDMVNAAATNNSQLKGQVGPSGVIRAWYRIERATDTLDDCLRRLSTGFIVKERFAIVLGQPKMLLLVQSMLARPRLDS